MIDYEQLIKEKESKLNVVDSFQLIKEYIKTVDNMTELMDIMNSLYMLIKVVNKQIGENK